MLYERMEPREGWRGWGGVEWGGEGTEAWATVGTGQVCRITAPASSDQ